MFSLTDTSVHTGVCIIRLSHLINLDFIFDCLEVDSSGIVKCVKYNNKLKGENTTKNTRTFYNQLTLVMFNKVLDKYINMKVFVNGTIKITGITSKNDCVIIFKEFKELLLSIKPKYREVQVYNYNGLLVTDDLIDDTSRRFQYHSIYRVFESNGKKYGYITGKLNDKNALFNCVSYVFFLDEPFMIERLHKNRVKKIINKATGAIIGECKYEIYNKKKNMVLKYCEYKKDPVTGDYHLTKWGDDYGKITFTYNSDLDVDVINEGSEEPLTITQVYNNSNFSDLSITEIEIGNINYDFKLILDKEYFWNFEKVFEVLNQMSSKYNYRLLFHKESIYNAFQLKISIKDNKHLSLEEEKLLEERKEKCQRITITFYLTGSINISGTTDDKSVIVCKEFFGNLIRENIHDMVLYEDSMVDASADASGDHDEDACVLDFL